MAPWPCPPGRWGLSSPWGAWALLGWSSTSHDHSLHQCAPHPFQKTKAPLPEKKKEEASSLIALAAR